MNGIGYLEDGTYVPCPQCKYEPPPEEPDIIPILPRDKGIELHKGDCPTVPQMDKETLDRLIEMDRVRRRGAAEAANFVIG